MPKPKQSIPVPIAAEMPANSIPLTPEEQEAVLTQLAYELKTVAMQERRRAVNEAKAEGRPVDTIPALPGWATFLERAGEILAAQTHPSNQHAEAAPVAPGQQTADASITQPPGGAASPATSPANS